MVLLAVIVTALAACGTDPPDDVAGDGGTPEATEEGTPADGQDGAETTAPEELTPLRVALLEQAGSGTVYVAAERGIFEDHGLDVEILPLGSGPAIIPGVIAGEFDVGFAAMNVIANAHLEGLPIKAIAPAYFEQAPEHLVFGVMATTEVENVADLPGKVVAINAVGTISEFAFMARFRELGINPDEVDFLLVDIPEMEPAFAQGRIDAAMVTEPFITTIEEAGVARVISPGAMPPEIVGDQRVLISSFLVSEEWLAENQETATAFVAAVDEAAGQMNEDLDQTLQDIAQHVTVPPDVLSRMALPLWDVGMQEADIQPFLDAAHETGFLDAPVSYTDIVAEQFLD